MKSRIWTHLMCFNPLQLLCDLCQVGAYSHWLLSPFVTIPVVTKSFAAVWRDQMSRLLLDSWFLWWDGIYRPQAGYATHFLKRSYFSSPDRHKEKGTRHHQPLVDLLVRSSSRVACAVLPFLSCAGSQCHWDGAVSRGPRAAAGQLCPRRWVHLFLPGS